MRVADVAAKGWKFQCEAGFIYSAPHLQVVSSNAFSEFEQNRAGSVVLFEAHRTQEPIANASTPDQASGWARFQGGVFLADPSVSVTA